MKITRTQLKEIISRELYFLRESDHQSLELQSNQVSVSQNHKIAAAMAMRLLRTFSRSGGKRNSAYGLMRGIFKTLDSSSLQELDRMISEAHGESGQGFLGTDNI